MYFRLFFVVFLGFLACLGFTQEVAEYLVLDESPLPVGTLIEAITELIKNWKGLQGIGTASAIVSLLTVFLKTEPLFSILNRMGASGPWVRRLAVLLFSQISGALISIGAGGSVWDSILTGLIVQGGAVAIYEHLKPFFKKKA